MNIAIILDTLGAGGAERQAMMCVSELRKLGHNADLIYYHPKVEYTEFLEDIDLEPIYVPGNLFVDRCRKLHRLFKERQYDVVHGFKMAAEAYAGVAGVWAGIPNRFGCFRVLYNLGYKYRIYHYCIDKLLCGWIVNSKAIADSMSQRTGIKRERISVLYNGLNAGKFCSSLTSAQAKVNLGLDENVTVITMVARLEPQKNYRMLMDSAEKVIRKRPDVKFLVVGQGTLEDEIKCYAASLEIADHILFLGRRSDIPDILAASDISVLTSDYEGLPNNIIEAMAAGKPIVCTDYQGHEEIMRHEENALISPCGQAEAFSGNILRLLQDDSLRLDIARNAQEYVQQHFLPEVMARNLEAIYRRYGH